MAREKSKSDSLTEVNKAALQELFDNKPTRRSKKKSQGELARLERLAQEAWLGLGDTSSLSVFNPLLEKTEEDLENPVGHMIKLIIDPDWFGFTCKHILNIELAPFQLVVLRELWIRPFPMLLASRGASKSMTLGLYAVLRALLCQGSKIVIVGSGFRQAKGVIEYSEKIWNNAPILRDIVGPGPSKGFNGMRKNPDCWVLQIGESSIKALPMGTGETIRGTRATHLIADEFASLNKDIFEIVVSGFGVVSASPVERMKTFAKFRFLQEHGLKNADEEPDVGSNQKIIAGTAYYQFNHFYKYWKQHKTIIESKGNIRKLEEVFNGEVPKGFDYKDYSIVRLPLELIPEGFMDEKIIASSRATMHSGNYALEYSCCFSADSNGFFRRTLVESCVGGKNSLPSFTGLLKGRKGFKYAMGIDPASENDNFAVVILELHPEGRRIVHCWTTRRSAFKERAKRGLSKDADFYYFAANKIRELHRLFPCSVIGIDAQGGGIQIIEALGNEKSITPEHREAGIRAILPMIDEDEPKDTDDLPGEHILKIIQFASAEWVSEANHGLKFDMESKALLFPSYDEAALGFAIEEDKQRKMSSDNPDEKGLYDNLEDCMLEIEEIKDELASIVHTRTGVSQRDRWDTPEIKSQTGKKGRMRKDRYSALLIANMEARLLSKVKELPVWEATGCFVGSQDKTKISTDYASAPNWFKEKSNFKSYGMIKR